MTLGLSPQLDAAFDRAGTAVLVTLDGAGHPIATTSRVEHDPAAGCFGLDVALGLPDPHAALVLADGGDDLVLVQGTARPSGAMGVQVRPERVYRWTGGDVEVEPELYDAPLDPGPACLLVLDAEHRELLVHGDLLEEDGRWVLRPRPLDRARDGG
jgi:hypothetical protein